MGRGRRGDARYWLDCRRKFLDSVDAMCHAAYERERMELFNIQTLLCNLLINERSDGRKVLVAERDGERGLRLHVSRPGEQKGYDEILLKIVVNE